MKKLIAVCAVLLFVAPAFAADWAWYGSERVGTWYTDRDNGGNKNAAGGQVNGQGDDAATQWNFQTNARVGARVKADKINGRIELRLSTGADGYGASNSGDTSVGTRLAWGEWKFSDKASLKIGKMDSTATTIINNKMFGDDDEMLGKGQFYGGRPAGMELNVGNFALGAFTPKTGGDVNAYGYAPATLGTATATGATNPGISGATNGEGDAYLPKVEARYKLDLGAGWITPFGGAQWYKIAPSGNGNVNDRLDVYSWVGGVGTQWNIGAFTIGGEVSYGMNMGNAGWATNYNTVGSTSSSSRNAYLKPGTATNKSDIADVYTTQAELVAALKFTDTLRFETGVGYTVDNADGAPGFSQKDDALTVYAQVMITLAPGVNVIPEVGYIDYMDDRTGNNEGFQWYAGAKWQIDF
jgi:hypothetical protein